MRRSKSALGTAQARLVSSDSRGSACCCALRPSGFGGSRAPHPRQAQEAERLRARLKAVEDALAAKETSERELHERTEKQARHGIAGFRLRRTSVQKGACASQYVLSVQVTTLQLQLQEQQVPCRPRSRLHAVGGRPIRAID